MRTYEELLAIISTLKKENLKLRSQLANITAKYCQASNEKK